MQGSLRFKRALKWAYAMSWGEQGFRALITLVLATILGPSEFGTVAIAMIYIMFIQMMLEQGLVAALIQRKNLRPEHLDSVFWAVVVASVVLVGLSTALGNWWAAVNGLPELSLIISVLSLSIPIGGFAIVQQALLRREMDFKSLSVRANVSVLVGGAVGIAMAVKGFGVWALVGQQLSRDLCALGLLWRLSHWRPRWQFSLGSLKQLLGFSIADFIAKLGDFANGQIDALVMGLFFGPVAVGLYRLAERLMNMVEHATTTALLAVFFPQFSRLQDSPAELRQSVLSCIRISAIVTIPPMAGLAATSDLLMTVIGERWTDAGDALKIFCLLGIFMGVMRFAGPLLQAKSKPQYVALLIWVLALTSGSTVLLIATLFKEASTWTQIVGVATARLGVSAVISILVLVYVLLRVCEVSLKSYIALVAPSFISGLATAAGVILLTASGLLQDLKPIVSLGLCVAVGGVSGIGTLLGLDSDLRRRVPGVA